MLHKAMRISKTKPKNRHRARDERDRKKKRIKRKRDLLNSSFALGIKGRSCFIQQHDLGLTHEAASDRDPLLLAPTHPRPAFTHPSKKPFGKLGDEVKGVGTFSCFLHVAPRVSVLL